MPTPTTSDDAAEPQMPNRALKTNRMAALLPVALTSGEPRGFTLASAPQGADLERFYSTVTSAQPMLPVPPREQAAPGYEPTAYVPEPAKPQAGPAEVQAAGVVAVRVFVLWSRRTKQFA